MNRLPAYFPHFLTDISVTRFRSPRNTVGQASVSVTSVPRKPFFSAVRIEMLLAISPFFIRY